MTSRTPALCKFKCLLILCQATRREGRRMLCCLSTDALSAQATTTDDDEDSTGGHDARMREDPLILAQSSVGAIYPDCSQPFDAFIYNSFHRSYAITFEAAKKRADPDHRSRKRQVLRQDGQRSSISIYFTALYFFIWDLSTIYTFSRYPQRRIFASHSRPPQLITMSSLSISTTLPKSWVVGRCAVWPFHGKSTRTSSQDTETIKSAPPPCNSPSAQSRGFAADHHHHRTAPAIPPPLNQRACCSSPPPSPPRDLCNSPSRGDWMGQLQVVLWLLWRMTQARD